MKNSRYKRIASLTSALAMLAISIPGVAFSEEVKKDVLHGRVDHLHAVKGENAEGTPQLTTPDGLKARAVSIPEKEALDRIESKEATLKSKEALLKARERKLEEEQKRLKALETALNQQKNAAREEREQNDRMFFDKAAMKERKKQMKQEARLRRMQAEYDAERGKYLEGRAKMAAVAPAEPLKGSASTNALSGSVEQKAAQLKRQSPRIDKNVVLKAGLTRDDLEEIAKREVVLIVDRSSSMRRNDCPSLAGYFGQPLNLAESFMSTMTGGISRWKWCQAHSLVMADAISAAAPEGITLVMFSGTRNVYPHVTAPHIKNVFENTKLANNSHLTAALAEQLTRYVSDKNPNKKPLAVAVVTDGKVSNTDELKVLLVQLTTMIKDPKQIKITFLQVGHNKESLNLFRELDNGLTSKGAQFDMVDCKSFKEVCDLGLARCIADALKEDKPANP